MLTVEAENNAGGNSDLTYEWDLDGDGIFETPGSNSIELQPGTGPDLYSAQVRITDGAGRWMEGRYQFTAGGGKIYALTNESGKALFRALTPTLPAGWHVHHTKQRMNGVLEGRYLKAGIDINHPSHLRGVPEFIHNEITADQNAWWAKKAKEGKFPSNINLDEVAAFEAQLDAKYSPYYVKYGAKHSEIIDTLRAGRRDAFLLVQNRAARRADYGIMINNIALFLMIANNSKVFAKMKSFNPNTHPQFGALKAKYEDCLLQAMGPGGRPSKEAAYQLVDTMIDFGRSMDLDQGALSKARLLMQAGLQREYS